MVFSISMYQIRPLRRTELPAVLSFTDREIGTGYFSLKELEDIFERSTVGDTTFSFVLEKNTESHPHEIHGIRITFPPGRWKSGKGKGLRTELWPTPLENVGYFQSLFLSREVQGQGWGAKLSQRSIALLHEKGSRAIATHAWKESPHNSSLKYLTKLGFQPIVEHPLYWIDVDYDCVVDGKPCRCTAVEMILEL